MSADPGDRRTAWPAVAAAAAVLAAAVAGVALLGGSERTVSPPPAFCLEAWNESPVGVGIGRHSYADHGYRSAWVVRVGEDGLPAGGPDCVARS